MVGDYCFVRSTGDDALTCVLVLKLYPVRIYYACGAVRKGCDDSVIKNVSKCITDVGLTHFCLRPDREPAILALLDAVCLATGRRGDKIDASEDSDGACEPGPDHVFDLNAADVPDAEKPPTSQEQIQPAEGAVIWVPEHSHPGESASNGKAESAVRGIVGMARTLKVAIEPRFGISTPFPCSHPIVAWISHSAWILNQYSLNNDGRTPWGLLHGREARHRRAEFAENIFFIFHTPLEQTVIFAGAMVPSSVVRWLAIKLSLRLHDGTITRARAMVRVVPSQRLDANRIQNLLSTPLQDHKTDALDTIEAEMSPHDHAATEHPTADGDHARARRRLNIEPRPCRLLSTVRLIASCVRQRI